MEILLEEFNLIPDIMELVVQEVEILIVIKLDEDVDLRKPLFSLVRLFHADDLLEDSPTFETS